MEILAARRYRTQTIEEIIPAWGCRPTPLLPAGLRVAWAGEILPDWVASELGLPPDATFAALGADVWRTMAGDEVPRYVRKFLLERLEGRIRSLGQVPLLGREWPDHVDPCECPFHVRTWNCLKNAGLLGRPDLLGDVTAWQLRRLKNMGVVSILDFACVAEAVLASTDAEASGRGAPPLPRALGASALGPDWRDQVTAFDPRFRGLLPIDAGTLGDQVRLIRQQRRQAARATRELRAAQQRVRTRLDRIRAMSLDDAIVDLVATASGLRPEETDFLIRRLGLAGEPPLTQKAVVASTGVGLSRLSRYEAEFFSNVPDHPVFLPQLDEAIALLEGLAPCPVDAASAELRARGLATTTAAVALVLRAARLFRRSAGVTVDASGAELRRR